LIRQRLNGFETNFKIVNMKIAYIFFKDITWLDFVGVYDPVSRLKHMNYVPDLEWDFCAYDSEVRDHYGLGFQPQYIDTTLADYDVIIVPGGYGTRSLLNDTGFMKWLKTAERVPLKISICTGSLLLGASGFLKNKKATTHFSEYDTLKNYCGEVIRERIVEDKGLITAGAVTSSIDLGLHLCKLWAGQEAAEEIRRRMDYRG